MKGNTILKICLGFAFIFFMGMGLLYSFNRELFYILEDAVLEFFAYLEGFSQ